MLTYIPRVVIFIMTILFFSEIVNGQQVLTLEGYVYNSQNNSPVPYAHVAILGTSKGTFTNESGYFILNQKYDTMKLSISAIGFQTKETNVFKSENIYLNPETTMLNEVVASPKKSKYRRQIAGVRKGSICCYYSGLKPFYALKIDNSEGMPGFIKEVTYKIGQPIAKSNRQKSLIRVRIYECGADGYPGRDILSHNVIFEVNENQKTIKVNLEEHNIPFLTTGVFVGVDFLGSKSKEGIMLKNFENYNSHLSIALTEAGKNQPAVTYRRNFNGEWENVSYKNEFQPNNWPNKVNALISAKIQY